MRLQSTSRNWLTSLAVILVLGLSGSLLTSSTALAATWSVDRGAISLGDYSLDVQLQVPGQGLLAATDDEDEDPWEEDEEDEEDEEPEEAPATEEEDEEPEEAPATELEEEDTGEAEGPAGPAATLPGPDGDDGSESASVEEPDSTSGAEKKLSPLVRVNPRVQIGLGIPLVALGSVATAVGVYSVQLGAILETFEIGLGIPCFIRGAILFGVAVPSIALGIKLLVQGGKGLKAQLGSLRSDRSERYALRAQHRVRWGMELALFGVPVSPNGRLR